LLAARPAGRSRTADPELAGLTIRCGERADIEVLIVLLQHGLSACESRPSLRPNEPIRRVINKF
jgi:hypothetical protein